MKVVVVIIDGAGDRPVAALGAATPLEHAFLPTMSLMAQRGRLGLVDAVFDDLPVESIVAALGILGYDPHRYFPNGRASFEAAAGGIHLGPRDLAFRCNLISTEGGRISDFTAGLIDDDRARQLILGVGRSDPRIEVFPSQSYRNIAVYRDAGVPAADFESFPPHQHVGRPIDEMRLRGRTPAAAAIADALEAFTRRSIDELARLNLEHATRAHMLWLWSPSDAPRLPSFRSRHGVRGAVVGGLHFVRGIGLAAQMQAPVVAGANGYLDSNLAGKAATAIDLLQGVDVVLVHLNAADEEAHQRSVTGKVRALELFDEVVIGPIVRHLRRTYPDGHRVAVLPDHYTCVADGHHIVQPVPCLVYGTGIAPDAAARYDEREAAERGSFHLDAWRLMPALLGDGPA